MAGSTLGSRARSTLMVGLPGPTLDPETAARVAEIRPAGVILFRRNLDHPERLGELLGALDQLLLPVAPLIAIDEEGGRVSRLAPWIGPTPTAWDLGRAGPARVREFAALSGAALGALGIDLNFAPVVDLCAPGAGNAIGDRAFGDAPEAVAAIAGSYLDALRTAGVAGCLKHFPGLGGTTVDSHLALPTVERDGTEIERHLRPFRDLVRTADAVMIGHGHYPAWNGPAPLPASASREIVRGVLRDDLAFRGLVASDDLEMGAVARLDADGAFALLALRAGCDLLLYCSDLARARRAADALAEAAARDEADTQRLAEASAAVERFAARRPTRRVRLDDFARARAEIARFVRAHDSSAGSP